MTTAAPYKEGAGNQGPGAPYNSAAKFFTLYSGDTSLVRTEIDSQAELKTADELHVPLPENNVDFHRLAQALAAGLPRQAALPTDKPAAEAWQQARREQLRAFAEARGVQL